MNKIHEVFTEECIRQGKEPSKKKKKKILLCTSEDIVTNAEKKETKAKEKKAQVAEAKTQRNVRKGGQIGGSGAEETRS